MDQEYNEYYIDQILIKGCVHYEDNSPVKGTIVILEKISCEEQGEDIYITHTLTNCYGEFCFFISDRTSYYKIKVFNNHHW